MTPREAMDNRLMHPLQWLAVAVIVGLNALDGFDVLSSAFAGRGIRQEWGLGQDGLGFVLSMELVGMGFGSLLLGGMADRVGRRPTMLTCLLLMAAGMFLATIATSPFSLSIYRIITGLGIGGMLAALNASNFELSSARQRSLATALMVIGYPLGAFLGGLMAAKLLEWTGDWRSIFLFGGIMTMAFIPLVWLFVPESPDWLNLRRPAGALERINAIFARFKIEPLSALPPQKPEEQKVGLSDIFAPQYLRSTIILSLGYAAHALTFYYILKMVPLIISDPDYAGQHFKPSDGAWVLAQANLGGVIGGAVFGWIMQRFGIQRSTMVALALSMALIIAFGMGQTTLAGWTWSVITAGLFTNSAIVGFYAAFAASYPTHAKATGTGFALSVGRAGAALSPILAGYLFKGQFGLMTTSMIMASGSLLALILFAGWRDIPRTQ